MTYRQKVFAKFGSKEFVDQLQVFMKSEDMVLEETEDNQIIEYFYNKHYNKIFIFNGLYLLQTGLCSAYIITHNEYVKFTMFGFCCYFLFVELI